MRTLSAPARFTNGPGSSSLGRWAPRAAPRPGEPRRRWSRALILLSALSVTAVSAVAVADVQDPAPREACLSGRLAKLSLTASLVEQKAMAIEAAAPDSSAKVKETLAKTEKDARDLQHRVRAAQADPTAPSLEKALLGSSLVLVWLHTDVVRLVFNLMHDGNDEGRKIALEMGDAIKAVRLEIPADDPTRGCE